MTVIFQRCIYRNRWYIGQSTNRCKTFSRNEEDKVFQYSQTRAFCDKTENIKMEKEKETFMIVGLCNHDMPKTRHSVGMMLVDRLARQTGIDLQKRKDCMGLVGVKRLPHLQLVLLIPKHPMNLNGKSVAKTATVYSVPSRHIYTVHDDLDKPPGKVAIKEKGSAGGHNGVRSVISCMKTDDFPRLRVGIDRPTSDNMVGDYVLQKFSRVELDVINPALDRGIELLAKHIASRVRVSAKHVFKSQETTSSTHERTGTGGASGIS